MENERKTKTIEVVINGNVARLQYREHDGIFTYIKPLKSGEVDKMREQAKEIYHNNKGIIYGEIDLIKLEELKKEAIKRHPLPEKPKRTIE